MLAAAARVGLVTSKEEWKQFTERFGANAMNPTPQFNSQCDRELILLLDASIACSMPEATVKKSVQAVTAWMSNGGLRLWRIVPYLAVCCCSAWHILHSFHSLIMHDTSLHLVSMRANMSHSYVMKHCAAPPMQTEGTFPRDILQHGPPVDRVSLSITVSVYRCICCEATVLGDVWPGILNIFTRSALQCR
jgi:hypothetical protein